jgi:hypothetical protein
VFPIDDLWFPDSHRELMMWAAPAGGVEKVVRREVRGGLEAFCDPEGKKSSREAHYWHFHKPPTHKSEKVREQNALKLRAIEAAT